MSIATSLASAIFSVAVLLFAILFIYLLVIWSKKRVGEISDRLESESNQFISKKKELKRLEAEITTLKNKKMDLIRRGNIKDARDIESEISLLQRKKDKLHKYIEDNY